MSSGANQSHLLKMSSLSYKTPKITLFKMVRNTRSVSLQIHYYMHKLNAGILYIL